MVTDLQLNYNEVLDKYPKSVMKVREWFRNHQNIKQNFKEMELDLDDDETLSMMVGLVIQFDPRKLYDVFDTLGIEISVISSTVTGLFTYYNNVSQISAIRSNRIDAEIAAFLEAFHVLETQLS